MSMNSQETERPLRFARELSADRQPGRIPLRLSDGYHTSVLAHATAAGAGALPVLYVHGIQSHPGWFVGSADHLARCGHEVFQVTRRGSGDNVSGIGDAASSAQLLRDLADASRFVLRRTGALRLHLVGVSWGGKLLAAYALDPGRVARVASLTMVAPGIVPRVDVSAATKIAIAFALLVAPQRRFGIPLSNVELFTDNEAMREYLREDRHRLYRATARFLYASRCLDRALKRAGEGALRIPTTLLLAGRDRIIDNDATREVVRRLTADQAVIRELDGSHTLEFEPDPSGLYDALTAATTRGE